MVKDRSRKDVSALKGDEIFLSTIDYGKVGFAETRER